MKKILCIAIALMMLLSMTACGGNDAAPKSGVEDGVLTVGMECAYAPYNWTQTDDSNGAVPIANVQGAYANGYDVMMAKKICEANGWQLEVKKLDWDSLVPAVQTGEIDCAIAGQSMTAERDKVVDFAGPYLYASIVCLVQKDSPLAAATGISQLTGTCTSQRGTIWYDTCLPQITGANIQSAADDAGAMLMAVSSGTCDFVCTDMPTAQGAVITYPNLTILDFSNSQDNFNVSAEEINIGISVREGNKTLLDAMNKVLSPMNADAFNALLAQAVAIQPIEE
ncbi:MAG: transporter substrate-binding domain-containing protein [Oscillospiraceae bacterium]|nr:transporter substrate-binding domain-containing protein [Oscillospiraceae bacterium]